MPSEGDRNRFADHNLFVADPKPFGARRIQHPSPPRPELERLLKESAKKVDAMTKEAHEKMVADQIKNIMPFAEDRARQDLGRFVELTDKVAAGLKEENVVRDELKIGRITPLTVSEPESNGIRAGGCMQHHPLHDLRVEEHIPPEEPIFAYPAYPTDYLSIFEKQLRDSRCPICGGREGCDHSKEERIREFARAGMRAQAKIEAQKGLDALRESLSKAANDRAARFSKKPVWEQTHPQQEEPPKEVLERFGFDTSLKASYSGCQGTPALEEASTPSLKKRILIVVSTSTQKFRLQSLTDDKRYLIVLPLDALPLNEKFESIILCIRGKVEELSVASNRKHERDAVRAWVDALRYVTVSRELKDVVYL